MASWSCRSAAVIGCLWLVAWSSGCNKQRNVTAVGTVLRGGQAIKLSPTGVLQVTLMPDVTDEQHYTTHVGRCDETGRFEIVDVPPGRYRVGIEQLDPNPQNDKLNAAFSYSNAKFKRDVDGKTALEIDLSKPDAK